MFKKIFRQIKNKGVRNKETGIESQSSKVTDMQKLSKELKENLGAVKRVFEGCFDIVIREFKLGLGQQIEAFLVTADGLVDKKVLNENLLKPLMLDTRITYTGIDINKNNTYAFIKDSALSISSVKDAYTLEEAVDAVLSGGAVLFIDGYATAMVALVWGFESRGVEEPDTESVVRGPREGFNETLQVNTSLLRRKIKNPDLKLELMKLGRQTGTAVCIAYIKGIADEKIIQEVRKRLERIETDSILESGYIESFIEDAPFSPFPTIANSEKPDIVSAKILEGRVAIFTDGTPFVLTVPYLLVEAFQNSEDYYSRPFYATLIRWLGLFGFGISVLLPAVYVSIATFHQELLPPTLLERIAVAREGTPFPLIVEAFLMQIIYEILREGGIRLPRPVGQAVSIVGALVIGEAAVSAGLIGAPMVVVVALTAISSFIVPALADVNVISRFFILFLSGIAGMYGTMMGVALILIHVCSIRSFGVPYTSPVAPSNISDMKDVIIRAPWWAMLTRPRLLGVRDPVRQKKGNMPKPPGNAGGE